jgi:23S rRNA pseudouridine1911/1915/1917 synthase
MHDHYEPLTHLVTAAEDGWKLRTVLRTRMLISRQLHVRLKQTEQGILVNGERKFADYPVRTGDLVEVRMPCEQSDDILPQKMDLQIVYEDGHVLVINKPPSLIVHPTHGHYINTLANGVVHYWQTRGERCRFRPVQRLDQDTSGLLLIAKTPFAHEFVSLQLRAHTVKKEYIALVRGLLVGQSGTVDAPIDRLPDNPHRRGVIPGGAPAITQYQVLEHCSEADVTMVRLRLLSGRTHQIRVHMEHIGHPLLGDKLYGRDIAISDGAGQGPETISLERQALHAQTLGFIHPGSRERVEFTSELPDDIKTFILSIRRSQI